MSESTGNYVYVIGEVKEKIDLIVDKIKSMLKTSNSEEMAKIPIIDRMFTIRSTFPGAKDKYNSAKGVYNLKDIEEVKSCINSAYKKGSEKHASFVKYFCNYHVDYEDISLVGMNDNGSGIYPATTSNTGRGSNVGNCVPYAWGRFVEILSELNPDATDVLAICRGNIQQPDAKDMFEQATATDYFKKVSVGDLKSSGYTNYPPVGSLCCVGDPNDNDDKGHVFIIENIDDDNKKIYISESAYGPSSSGYIFRYQECDKTQYVVKSDGTATIRTRPIVGFLVPKFN